MLRIDRIDQLDHKNGPANGQVTAILTAEATLLAGAGANTSLDSRKSGGAASCAEVSRIEYGSLMKSLVLGMVRYVRTN